VETTDPLSKAAATAHFAPVPRIQPIAPTPIQEKPGAQPGSTNRMLGPKGEQVHQ
jgi:hypothetical protein